jgi:hypothetical protein
MLSIEIDKPHYTLAEKYFLERTLELVHRFTIDSYRVRLHSFRSILEECQELIEKFHLKKIRDWDYVNAALAEASLYLDRAHLFDFAGLDAPWIKRTLGTCNATDYRIAFGIIGKLLSHNKDYQNKVTLWVFEEIQRCNAAEEGFRNQPNASPPSFERLERAIQEQIAEIVNAGFSRNFLNHKVFELFIEGTRSFAMAYEALSEIVARETEKFKVIFKIQWPDEFAEILVQAGAVPSTDVTKAELEELGTSYAATFLKARSDHFKHLVPIEVKAKDYFAAVRVASRELEQWIDLFNAGFAEWQYPLYDQAFVIGDQDPDKGRMRPTVFNIDGYSKGGPRLAAELYQRIGAIRVSDKISDEAKEKIGSVLRYLRLGHSQVGLEPKFLNYWIGIESIYSSKNMSLDVFKRIDESYCHSHTLIYAKRLFQNFISDIQRISKDRPVLTLSHAKYDGSAASLMLNPEILIAYISQAMEHSSVAATRAYELHKLIGDKGEALRKKLKEHEERLKWNLLRIYRIRNEIVHNGRYIPNLETVTGHARYYLLFSLSRFIDFFGQADSDPLLDQKLGSEDFFTNERMCFESVMLGFRENKGEFKNHLQALAKVAIPEGTLRL